MEAEAAPASAAGINQLEAEVVAAMVQQHAAWGYRVTALRVNRQPEIGMITATVVMAKGPEAVNVGQGSTGGEGHKLFRRAHRS